MSDDEGPYVCNLDEATLQKAIDELEEDPAKRQEHLDTFRKWVKAQPHIKSRTDNLFLLRFLRIARYDQKLAGEVLDNFWTARTVPGKGIPEWFDNMDPAHPHNLELFQGGFAFALPGVDYLGRTVAYFCPGGIDPQKVRFNDVVKVMFMSVDAKLREEEFQINGLSILLDFTGFSPGHAAKWTPIRIHKASKCIQGTYPSRHRSINMYNTPMIVNPLIESAKLYMDEKIRERLHFHRKNMESLHKEVPPHILPIELGGTAGTKKELAERWKEELLERRDEILLVANPRYGIDEEKRPKTSKSTWQEKLRNKFATGPGGGGPGAGPSGAEGRPGPSSDGGADEDSGETRGKLF